MSDSSRYGKIGSKRTTISTAIATALAPAGYAVAQQPETDENIIEEVMVTATLRESSMQDLAQSLQAFTTQQIERNAFTNFNDVANALPSLTLIADQPGRNSVKFRGVSTGTGEYYTDSTSAIYFDETPLTFSSQQLWPAMVDIARVESLPGPQGTLFGAAALAGTVRVVTNRPDTTGYSGQVYAEYFDTQGGDGSYAVNGWLNVPLIEDTLAMRFVGHTRDEGGWIDNVLGNTYVQPAPQFTSPGNNSAIVEDNYNDYSLTGGRASLLWNVNDNWETVVTLIAEDNSSEGAWGDDSNLPEYQHSLFYKENRDDNWWNAGLLINGDLGFATLTSSTTYLDREITYEFDNMIYEQWKDSYFGVYYGFALYNTEYTYGYLFNDQTQDRVSQELRLTSNGDSRFQWMVGAFYEKIDDQWLYGAVNNDLVDTIGWYYANYLAYYYSYNGIYDIPYPLTPTNLAYTQRLDRTNTQLAFFGEATFQITEKWWVTGGARWFKFEQDYLEQNQFPEGLAPPGSRATNGIVTSQTDVDDMVYKFSTQYFFNDDHMIYLLYSEGFRPGGENSQRASGTGLIPVTFEPDFLNNYEIGGKTEWLDNRLQINLTLFLMEWNNRQFSEGGVGGQWWLRGTVNGGDTEYKGVELGVTWQITDSLLFTGNLTNLKAEAKSTYEFLNGDVIEPGDPLPNAPELQYWAALDYTFPFELFGGELWTRVDYAYGDEWWNSTGAAINRSPAGLIPDWSNTNLQLGLNLPNEWIVTLFVRNLTDERRVNNRQDNSYASDWFDTDEYAFFDFVNRPIHYGFSVRKTW